MESLNLKGKVAIITGSSSGIGEAAARLMAKRGAKITVHGRDRKKMEKLKEDFVKDGIKADNILLVTGDITKPEVREELVSKTVDTFGRLDILVNNAGGAEPMPLVSLTQESLQWILNLNLFSPIFLSQLCVPHLTKTKGNIINVSSCGADTFFPGFCAYSVSKAGLDAFAQTAAIEFASLGIRVNTVRPGWTDTPAFTRDAKTGNERSEEEKQQLLGYKDMAPKFTLLGVNCQMDDIAEMIAFYASDAARMCTGAIGICDAGYSVRSKVCCFNFMK